MTEQEHPIVPYRTFVVAWLLLLLLTTVTVAVSRVHLGPLNIWAALGIAAVKSALVIFFFMHLGYEKLQAFRIFLLVTLLILAIFLGFTFFDVLYR